MQRLTALVVIATLTLLVTTVPTVKVLALEWWQPIPDNRTAEQKAKDAAADKEALAAIQESLSRLECLKNHKTEYVEAGQCGTPTIEQQLQNAREATSLAAQSPPCKLKNFTGGIITMEEWTERCNTNENILRNMTMTTTEDDGYTYPKNATEEEKKAIDAQQYKAWIEAGRPGELVK